MLVMSYVGLAGAERLDGPEKVLEKEAGFA